MCSGHPRTLGNSSAKAAFGCLPISVCNAADYLSLGFDWHERQLLDFPNSHSRPISASQFSTKPPLPTSHSRP
jgi:hypothetical protein